MVTVQAESHSDDSHASTGLPALSKAFRFYVACGEIINTVNVASGITADSKAVAESVMINVYLLYSFEAFIIEDFMFFTDKKHIFFIMFTHILSPVLSYDNGYTDCSCSGFYEPYLFCQS